MTQDEKGYQGWTNYETWLVALWLDNDQGTHEAVREVIFDHKNDSTHVTSCALKDFVEEMNPITEASLWMDLVNGALSEVDWREITEHYLDEE